MANKTTRSFYYKALRDIISSTIGTIFAFVGFIVLYIYLPSFIEKMNEGRMTSSSDKEIAMACIGGYLVIAIYCIISSFLSIYKKSFRKMTIRENEITYSYGWISKGEVTISSNKIRSCSKHCDWIQSLCGTMDIHITTAGDGPDINFYNIEYGEEAYKIILRISRCNRS